MAKARAEHQLHQDGAQGEGREPARRWESRIFFQWFRLPPVSRRQENQRDNQTEEALGNKSVNHRDHWLRVRKPDAQSAKHRLRENACESSERQLANQWPALTRPRTDRKYCSYQTDRSGDDAVRILVTDVGHEMT